MRKLIKLLVITFMLTALPGLALANNTNSQNPVEFQSAHFILNKNYYFKNEQRQNMDATVFAQGGRTYVPFRYLAYALGVPEENVTWDATTKKVTLINEPFPVFWTRFREHNLGLHKVSQTCFQFRIYSTVLLTWGPLHPLDSILLGGNKLLRRISAFEIVPEGATPYQ